MFLCRRAVPVVQKCVRTHATGIMTVEQFEREFYSANVVNYDQLFMFNIIKSNLELGQDKTGVGYGGMHLSNNKYFHDFIRCATQNGWCLNHEISIDTEPSIKKSKDSQLIKHGEQIDATTSRIFTANQYSEENNNMTINLLGDHSSSIGTIVSKWNDNILIWIDAHADINTPDSSLTGHCHGMPLGIATGLCDKELKEHDMFSWIPNYFPLDNIVYVGIRDLDPFEKDIIEKHGIMVLQEDSKKEDFDKFYDKINGKYTHVSFDVDSLDPEHFPCTGTPVENGLTPSFVKDLITKIRLNSTLNKLDIVEYNPHISTNDVDRCNRILVEYVLKALIE